MCTALSCQIKALFEASSHLCSMSTVQALAAEEVQKKSKRKKDES